MDAGRAIGLIFAARAVPCAVATRRLRDAHSGLQFAAPETQFRASSAVPAAAGLVGSVDAVPSPVANEEPADALSTGFALKHKGDRDKQLPVNISFECFNNMLSRSTTIFIAHGCQTSQKN